VAKKWQVEWMVVTENGERRVPGFDFLAEIPKGPQTLLLAILDAVTQMGPDQWKDPDTHTPMSGPCEHLHEARDKLDQTLYRLYLYWQRDARRVIVITGATKPNSTALPTTFYDELAAQSKLLDGDDPPLATLDDIARLALELVERAKEAENRAEAAERDVDDLLQK
jgi:hypothetical protein